MGVLEWEVRRAGLAMRNMFGMGGRQAALAPVDACAHTFGALALYSALTCAGTVLPCL